MPGLQLDVESLRALIAVLELGGMTRASDRLNLTQSGVSWKIKRLEERVGRPLLIRDGHRLTPTRDARALLPDARRIVEIHDRVVARLESSDLEGTVLVGSNEEIDPGRMASLLGRFSRAHPGATIEFVIDYSRVLAEQLRSGHLDVAIIQVDHSQLLRDDVVLWEDQLVWVTSREYPYQHVGPVPLITFGERHFYRRLSEPLLDRAGIEHYLSFAGMSTPGVRAAIAAGLGVGVLGSRYVGDDIVTWRPGDDLPPLPRVYQVARTVPGEAPEVAEVLVAAIREELLDPAAEAINDYA